MRLCASGLAVPPPRPPALRAGGPRGVRDAMRPLRGGFAAADGLLSLDGAPVAAREGCPEGGSAGRSPGAPRGARVRGALRASRGGGAGGGARRLPGALPAGMPWPGDGRRSASKCLNAAQPMQRTGARNEAFSIAASMTNDP